MDIKFSVIIPVYNGEKFIARAIESVLKQSYPAYEVIVINDGSKDQTEQVLKNFGSKIIYKTIPNGGVSNARNNGIMLSTGDWVAFIDADDIWFPERLQKQVDIIKKYKDVGFSCCNFIYTSVQGDIKKDHLSRIKLNVPYNVPTEKGLQLLLQENITGTSSTVIVNKQLLNKTGLFNVSFKQAEDLDLWIRCAFYTSCLFSTDVLLEKCTHEENLTNNQIETAECHKQVFLNLRNKEKDLLMQKGVWSLLGLELAKKNYQIGNFYFEKKMYSRAYNLFIEGLGYSLTFRNLGVFLTVFLKKTLRLVTFGLISRKSFQKTDHKYYLIY